MSASMKEPDYSRVTYDATMAATGAQSEDDVHLRFRYGNR